MPGIELTQANLSKKDLLEGRWEYSAEPPFMCPKNLGGKYPFLPSLSGAPWSPTSAYLSQDGIHSSSSLWTRRISSLLDSGGPKMAGCLNSHLQNPTSLVLTIHELKSQFQLFWEKESNGTYGSQSEDGVFWPVPNQQQRRDRSSSSEKVPWTIGGP